MPRFPLRLKTPAGARYLEWSTVVDAPVTFGLTLVHDLDRDVKIYTCDQPIANDLLTPGEAMAAATEWLDNNLTGERA